MFLEPLGVCGVLGGMGREGVSDRMAIGKKGNSIEVTRCALWRFFIKSYSVQIGSTNYDPF